MNHVKEIIPSNKAVAEKNDLLRAFIEVFIFQKENNSDQKKPIVKVD